MGGNLIWLMIMAPCSALFTGLGIYAWRRKKPMWFWSGTSVRENEISDVPAYNRANGIMWLVFSAVLWAAAVLGFLRGKAGGILLIAGCAIGVPLLPIVYGRICRRYRKTPRRRDA